MNILIVDDERDLVDIMEFLVRDNISSEANIFLAYNGKEAIEILKRQEIDLCICDHNMPNGPGNEVLRFITTNSLKTRFILCSTVLPSDMKKEYPTEHLYFFIEKPDILDGLVKLSERFINELSNPILAFSPPGIFIPVTTNFLYLIKKLPTDIYIKVSADKYVKCLHRDELFEKKDLDKYASKEVSRLYIKKGEDKIDLNKIIDSTVRNLMTNENMSLEERMSLAHAQLCETIKFTGMSPDMAETTKENVNQTVKLIMKSSEFAELWKNLNLKGEYPSKLYTLHSMLGSVILKKLKWTSEATMFKLTLAAFLQDVTLTSLALMKIYDYRQFKELENTFTDEDVKCFLDHPMRIKDLLKNFKEIPPDIDKIVFEQHEMPDGSGFPRKLNAQQLGPLSCLFILSGIMSRYILNEGSNFDLKKFVDEFENHGYSKGNFKDPFNVIKSWVK